MWIYSYILTHTLIHTTHTERDRGDGWGQRLHGSSCRGRMGGGDVKAVLIYKILKKRKQKTALPCDCL